MGDITNRRTCTRAIVRVKVRMLIEGQEFFGWLRDVSLKGFFMQLDDHLPALGTSYPIEILVDEEVPSSFIRANARIVRSDKKGIGLEFLEIAPDGSQERLMNMVSYNSTDSGKMRFEVRKLSGHQRVRIDIKKNKLGGD